MKNNHRLIMIFTVLVFVFCIILVIMWEASLPIIFATSVVLVISGIVSIFLIIPFTLTNIFFVTSFLVFLFFGIFWFSLENVNSIRPQNTYPVLECQDPKESFSVRIGILNSIFGYWALANLSASTVLEEGKTIELKLFTIENKRKITWGSSIGYEGSDSGGYGTTREVSMDVNAVLGRDKRSELYGKTIHMDIYADVIYPKLTERHQFSNYKEQFVVKHTINICSNDDISSYRSNIDNYNAIMEKFEREAKLFNDIKLICFAALLLLSIPVIILFEIMYGEMRELSKTTKLITYILVVLITIIFLLLFYLML